MSTKDRIIIEVSGGVVNSISGIPKGLCIEVRDFDTDGVDAVELEETPDGQAIVTIWQNLSDIAKEANQ